MMEHKLAALNTFQQTQWRERFTWSRGTSRTMIDFFLVPKDMLKGKLGPRDGKGIWNMQSDHRVIQMKIPGNEERKRRIGHNLGEGKSPTHERSGKCWKKTSKAT